MTTELKIQQTHAVFSKAIDATISSLGTTEIDKCFGDIKEEFGGQLESALANNLNRARNNLEVRIHGFNLMKFRINLQPLLIKVDF